MILRIVSNMTALRILRTNVLKKYLRIIGAVNSFRSVFGAEEKK